MKDHADSAAMTGPEPAHAVPQVHAVKRPPLYEVSIPRDSKGPLTLTKNGKVVDLAFQGQTKDGITLRVTAKCGQILDY